MPAQVAPISSQTEIIEFEIEETRDGGASARSCYGISVAKVREVIKIEHPITPTPKDHPAMAGVIDLRGEVIPVVNLPKWLGVFDPRFSYDRIVIAEFNLLRAGFLVSRVNRIHKIPTEKIEPPAALMSVRDREVVTGISRLPGKIILLLDFEKILADIDPESGADLSDMPVTPPTAETKPKTVLLAEDSALMLSMLEKAFKQAGFAVYSAENGRDALDQLQAIEQKAAEENVPVTEFIDLVVTDMEMPLMDGAELIARINNIEAFEHTPIIIFSSIATAENIEKWQMLNTTACISKPEVKRLIDAALHATARP